MSRKKVAGTGNSVNNSYSNRKTCAQDCTAGLEVYLVGGAVRDRLLGLAVCDRDWVVVGTTGEQMLARGFKPVGEDFPVFLHPHSGEQYALARRERKTGKGYRGFAVFSDPSITLEQDLARRDLTINAIAQKPSGELVDPFNGARDIEARCLRHVSAAFSEDPVRVLRVARFAARFASHGFTVHAQTRELMARMVADGEVDALQAERVWQELHGALCTPDSARFIQELRDCGALAKILPEVDALFGVPQSPEHHPEIDTGVHLLLSLQAAHRLGGANATDDTMEANEAGEATNTPKVPETTTTDPRIIFAVLTHDLGKALTPKRVLPKHHGHEVAGLKPLEAMCDRLRTPYKYRQLARVVCRYHLHHHRMAILKPGTVLTLLQKLDAFRSPENAHLFSQCCVADLRGRTGKENSDCPQARLFAKYHRAAQSVDATAIATKFTEGEKIKQALARARISAIAEVKRTAMQEN